MVTPPGPTETASWAALLARDDVVERCVLASTFGFMAFHAGLEAGTLELAESAAESSGASCYSVVQPTELRWHVPSTAVDPAHSEPLRLFLAHVQTIVALHGYGRRDRPRDVLIGGANRRLAAAFADELRSRDCGLVAIDDLDAIPSRLRGLHPNNPVNRAPAGGIQVELPVRARLGEPLSAVVEALAATARRPVA